MVLLVGDKGATLALLLILYSVLFTLPNMVMVKASGTIYIRADGTVEGTDTIQRDGNVYTFTDNIYEPLVVERDNIVVDGAGYSIEGPHTNLVQSPEGIGILVESRSDVTIGNMAIQHFLYGICINSSFTIRITNGKITDNGKAIYIENTSDSIIRESQITNNIDVGIYVFESSDTNIINNIIENNINDGISLILSSDNTVVSCNIRDNGVGIRIMDSSITPLITWNNITSNGIGIHLEASSAHIQYNNIATNGVGIQLAGSDNIIDRNNFINNTKQVYDVTWDNPEMPPSVNTWYSGDAGNYWSDYNGTGDKPYVIDEKNKDNFPVMKPFTIPSPPCPPDTTIGDFTLSNFLWSVIIITAVAAVLLVYFGKIRNTGKTESKQFPI
jgi:parallel beta-helix repeat protein